MDRRYGKRGSSWTVLLMKRAKKGDFILYKRVYYVLQVVFVASIYKRTYTRGLGTKGRGSVSGRGCYPCCDELFLQKDNH